MESNYCNCTAYACIRLIIPSLSGGEDGDSGKIGIARGVVACMAVTAGAVPIISVDKGLPYRKFS